MIQNHYQGQIGPSRLPILIVGLLLVFQAWARPAQLEGQIPRNQVHISMGLGGHFLVGVGYTHWIEEHQALEATVYPFAYPGQGFPFGIKLGYAWVPSAENWRAKLGGNVTVLVRRPSGNHSRFTPIIAFTPGIQYDPGDERSIRTDFWMSYYPTEKAFAPSLVEFIYGWKK